MNAEFAVMRVRNPDRHLLLASRDKPEKRGISDIRMKNVDFVVANDFADIVDKNARMTVSRRTDLHDFHAKLLKIAPQLILAFAIICDDKIVAILQAPFK